MEPAIDPSRTTVVVTVDGIKITPRDPFGNPLGPGRGGNFDVAPVPGVSVTGPVKDNGDGSYTVPVSWSPGVTPGIIVSQPDRPPVPLGPSPSGPLGCAPIIWMWIAIGLFVVVVILLILLLAT